MKKKDGEEYEPTTLRSFVSNFDSYLRKKGYPTAIIEGQEFRKTRETLVAKQIEKSGKGKQDKGGSRSDDLKDTVWYSNLALLMRFLDLTCKIKIKDFQALIKRFL